MINFISQVRSGTVTSFKEALEQMSQPPKNDHIPIILENLRKELVYWRDSPEGLQHAIEEAQHKNALLLRGFNQRKEINQRTLERVEQLLLEAQEIKESSKIKDDMIMHLKHEKRICEANLATKYTPFSTQTFLDNITGTLEQQIRCLECTLPVEAQEAQDE